MIHDTIDGLLIDVDDDGFHLVVSGHKAEYGFKLPQDVALELMRAVKREIEPWAAEGGIALGSYERRNHDTRPRSA